MCLLECYNVLAFCQPAGSSVLEYHHTWHLAKSDFSNILKEWYGCICFGKSGMAAFVSAYQLYLAVIFSNITIQCILPKTLFLVTSTVSTAIYGAIMYWHFASLHGPVASSFTKYGILPKAVLLVTSTLV